MVAAALAGWAAWAFFARRRRQPAADEAAAAAAAPGAVLMVGWDGTPPIDRLRAECGRLLRDEDRVLQYGTDRLLLVLPDQEAAAAVLRRLHEVLVPGLQGLRHGIAAALPGDDGLDPAIRRAEHDYLRHAHGAETPALSQLGVG